NSTRATVGAKMNEVDSTKQRLTRAQGDYQNAVSNVEDVDLATAYVQLQSAQNVYQASLVTTSKAFQHSLSDYL
ncbi:MAG: flagellar biosynthesis protein FlgL, partial [Armatimonadota bacterium]|nr:flagellar biosynthesis protein FlgL [Armatimonadota bacterium]